jgi:hypothetical protein
MSRWQKIGVLASLLALSGSIWTPRLQGDLAAT